MADAFAGGVCCSRASFSTSSPAAQKQQQKQTQQQQDQDQKQQSSLQARQNQSRIIQFEFKQATIPIDLSGHTTFPLPLRQAGVLPHPIKTAKHVWRLLFNKFSVFVALGLARQNIPGHSSLGDTELQHRFASMYVRINEAQASFAIDRIKDVSGLQRLALRVFAQLAQMSVAIVTG
jgi:hypothetical protein